MAQLKLKKYPKKPKQSASVATLENYLRKVKEVDTDNRKIKAENAKQKSLAKKVATLRPGSGRTVSIGTRRKKASVSGVKKGRKKTAITKRRRR